MMAVRTAIGTKRNVLWRNEGISFLPKNVMNDERSVYVIIPIQSNVSQSVSGAITTHPFLLMWFLEVRPGKDAQQYSGLLPGDFLRFCCSPAQGTCQY